MRLAASTVFHMHLRQTIISKLHKAYPLQMVAPYKMPLGARVKACTPVFIHFNAKHFQLPLQCGFNRQHKLCLLSFPMRFNINMLGTGHPAAVCKTHLSAEGFQVRARSPLVLARCKICGVYDVAEFVQHFCFVSEPSFAEQTRI